VGLQFPFNSNVDMSYSKTYRVAGELDGSFPAISNPGFLCFEKRMISVRCEQQEDPPKKDELKIGVPG